MELSMPCITPGLCYTPMLLTPCPCPDLISGVKHMSHEASERKQELHSFLTTSTCSLFRDAPLPVHIDATSIDRLYRKGRAGVYTIEHVRALDAAGGRFGSFHTMDELCVSGMTQQRVLHDVWQHVMF